MTINNIINRYKSVPNLTERSKIRYTSKMHSKKGLIFDSLEKLTDALTVYDNASRDRYQEILNSKFLKLEENTNDPNYMSKKNELVDTVKELEVRGLYSSDYISKLIDRINSSMIDNDSFKTTKLEYDSLKTIYCEASFKCSKLDDNYVLTIDNPKTIVSESELAVAHLNAERLTYTQNVECIMSTIDDHWYNINLKKSLSGLDFLTNEDFDEAAKYIKHNHINGHKVFKFDHEGQEYGLEITLKGNQHTRSTTRDNPYFEQRGDNFVGAAWFEKTSGFEGKSPEIIIKIGKYDENDQLVPLYKQDDTTNLHKARDYIKSKIQTEVQKKPKKSYKANHNGNTRIN